MSVSKYLIQKIVLEKLNQIFNDPYSIQNQYRTQNSLSSILFKFGIEGFVENIA